MKPQYLTHNTKPCWVLVGYCLISFFLKELMVQKLVPAPTLLWTINKKSKDMKIQPWAAASRKLSIVLVWAAGKHQRLIQMGNVFSSFYQKDIFWLKASDARFLWGWLSPQINSTIIGSFCIFMVAFNFLLFLKFSLKYCPWMKWCKRREGIQDESL